MKNLKNISPLESSYDPEMNNDNYSILKILRNIPSSNSPFGIFTSNCAENSSSKISKNVGTPFAVKNNNKENSSKNKKCKLNDNKSTSKEKEKISHGLDRKQKHSSQEQKLALKSNCKTTRKRRLYSDEEKLKALEVYRECNFDLEEAAKKLDIPVGTLINWVYKKKRIIKSKPLVEKSKKIISEISTKKKNKEAVSEASANQEETAQKLEVQPKSKQKSKRIKNKYTIEERAQAVNYYHQGSTLSKAARKFSIPTTTLQQWIKKNNNTDCQKNDTSRKKLDRNFTIYSADQKKQAINMVCQGKLKLKEVARKLGIPSGTLWCWMYKIGKKKMNPEEKMQ